MSAPVTKLRAIVNGDPWVLQFTPSACVALEEVSGKNLLEFIRDFRPGRPKPIYQCFYALGETYRCDNGDYCAPGDRQGHFRRFLDHFPAFNLKCPSWLNFEAQAFELVSENFFGRSWAEMKAIAEEATQVAQETIGSTGETGPTSDTTSSDGSLTPSGTE